jgi:hypothetical protein
VNGDEVRAGAKADHGLGLAQEAFAVGLGKGLTGDDGERDLPSETLVAGEVDPLASSLAEQAQDPIAAGGEG